MHNPAGVDGRNRLGDTSNNLNRIRHTEWFASRASSEILTVKPLHDEVRTAICPSAVVHIVDDSWVTKIGESGGFAVKSCAFFIGGSLVEEFDSYVLSGLEIAGAIDFPHGSDACSR